MTDQNLFGYEGGGQTEIAPGSSNTKGAYKFTPEELQVLQQCNNESFFKRSLPLGTLLGLGTFMGVQKGHFKASPRFGAFPKVTLAVIVGYFLGKISYQRACAEKLMALPGSYIGQLLRDKKRSKQKLSVICIYVWSIFWRYLLRCWTWQLSQPRHRPTFIQ
ncbi:unnamed protein product [Leptidea sinapis]|uniref:OCIA domain-containing protein n=1 Tax=Leptidea sinapis TaxID=189913 RepID=A0A5E4PMW6_9NEOP|nr:unnamed protein product [Leptidea sinapis]